MSRHLLNGNEAQIIQQAKDGDQLAFETLYNANKAKMYLLCVRMTNNPGVAEELMQESFLLMYRKLGMFRGESTFSTWLYRITVNTVLMYFRRKKLNLLYIDDVKATEKDLQTFDVGKLDPLLNNAIERRLFWNAFDALPKGYRIVFFLHDIEGYEHHEVAELLRCSIGTSKSQLHKAHAKLLSILNPEKRSSTFHLMFRAENPRTALHKGTH